VAGLFDGHPAGSAGRGPETPRFRVEYFRDRNDYLRSLRAAMSRLDTSLGNVSLGVYLQKKKTAYFFAGQDSDSRTLYHEATHQLFAQSRRVWPEAGSEGNFWIIEGVAVFMESLQEKDGYFVLGGFDDVRVNAARYHLATKDFYIPFATLVGYRRDRLQRDPKIESLYSQAAGMTDFLILCDGGRYRDALVDYLIEVYTGHDRPDTLSKLTGSSYEELDRQYRRFMRVDPQ
jgi:hypothetical protein